MFCLILSRSHNSLEKLDANRGVLVGYDFFGKSVVGEDIGGVYLGGLRVASISSLQGMKMAAFEQS